MDTAAASPAREREAALLAQCLATVAGHAQADSVGLASLHELAASLLQPRAPAAALALRASAEAWWSGRGVAPLSLHFDPYFNPKFALLHADYQQDAIPVDLGVPGIDLKVLAPVDLALSKIARLGDVDREDIASLVAAGLTDAPAIRARAEAALTGYIGNPADIRQRIDAAVELARDARRDC